MTKTEIDKLRDIQVILSGCEMAMMPCHGEKRGPRDPYSPFCRICRARDMLTSLIVGEHVARAFRTPRKKKRRA